MSNMEYVSKSDDIMTISGQVYNTIIHTQAEKQYIHRIWTAC